MKKLYEILENLVSYPGISGREDMAYEGLCDYLKTLGIFDEVGTTDVGSVYGIMRSKKDGVKTVMCDAHLDTVGFLVTEILDGGFLRIATVGGIAAKILSASPVDIHGDRKIRGVFVSKPPHLQTPGESEQKQEVTDILIDTGMPKEELEKIVRIGTPVSYNVLLDRLCGDNLAGAGFDDRLCGAAILRGLLDLDKESLGVNVAFLFSGGEEVGYKGAITGTYQINPDCAIVLDVTHAYLPDTPKVCERVRAGKGCVVAFSPKTNREFTKKSLALIEEKQIPVQLSTSPGRTGTNSGAITVTRSGVPVLQISIPLKNMHTQSEIVDMRDAMSAANAVTAVIADM